MLLANAGMLSDKTIKFKTHMTQHSKAGRDRGLILRAAVHHDLNALSVRGFISAFLACDTRTR